MNVSELVANLTQHGVHLQAERDKLCIRAPKGVLTPEQHAELAARKGEILAFLHEINITASTTVPLSQGLSLYTIGRLIGGFCEKSTVEYKQPIIEPREMAQKLTVTFRPLPSRYKNEEILRFREELKAEFQSYGVKVEDWDKATKEYRYELNLPLIRWKRNIKTRIVKTGINAIIDVERPSSLIRELRILIAETIYQIYSRFFARARKMSVPTIVKLASWAEDHASQRIEDPTNTQTIILTELNKLANFRLPYQKKIKIGLSTLIRTYSQMVIGVSNTNISILNMNLSDSIFPRTKIDGFVLHSLIPKIFVPIFPLPMSRFELGQYDPLQSKYADKLVVLSKELAKTDLLPPGSKLSEFIRRKSHRDIVSIIMDGRTGVSYGFVAYAEAPQYFGPPEISEDEWESLFPVEEFSIDEVRQNKIGRWYVKVSIGTEHVFKQIPDIWLVSSRSGSNKTDLNLDRDIVRIGLKGKLFLQFPKGIDPKTADIKPSYDVYVMLAIALSTALYAPGLIRNGAPIVHFHGYPAFEWFRPNEYGAGVNNPSVPCGTYESGVFNFLSISSLANQYGGNIVLASLIEPDHGTNVIASDLDYLVKRLKAGCEQGLIELGGKHFTSLKEKIANY
ncbi:MAG: hypothetical protein JOZ78_22070 [Chroococcidiopsidaceae cyanobacterium CP_BM_ER_R8_30]|nr:hypothetical protein [Chroococcidiopsidaceae cyanobacterium CP_BM_ER_R8_30]